MRQIKELEIVPDQYVDCHPLLPSHARDNYWMASQGYGWQTGCLCDESHALTLPEGSAEL